MKEENSKGCAISYEIFPTVSVNLRVHFINKLSQYSVGFLRAVCVWKWKYFLIFFLWTFFFVLRWSKYIRMWAKVTQEFWVIKLKRGEENFFSSLAKTIRHKFQSYREVSKTLKQIWNSTIIVIRIKKCETARDIHIECSKQFKWNLYFYWSGQSGPFWAELKLL